MRTAGPYTSRTLYFSRCEKAKRSGQRTAHGACYTSHLRLSQCSPGISCFGSVFEPGGIPVAFFAQFGVEGDCALAGLFSVSSFTRTYFEPGTGLGFTVLLLKPRWTIPLVASPMCPVWGGSTLFVCVVSSSLDVEFRPWAILRGSQPVGRCSDCEALPVLALPGEPCGCMTQIPVDYTT